MEYEKLAKELVEMQVENARPLSWIADCIAARGEEQLLLMLAHRDKAVCAGELAECVGLTRPRGKHSQAIGAQGIYRAHAGNTG